MINDMKMKEASLLTVINILSKIMRKFDISQCNLFYLKCNLIDMRFTF